MRFIAFALALLTCGPVHAQSWATRDVCFPQNREIHPEIFEGFTYSDVQNQAADVSNGVGKFWRIISPEGTVSYLWGTIHSNDPVLLKLPEQVESTIKNARIVATELNYQFSTRQDIFESYTSTERYLQNGDASLRDLNIPTQLRVNIKERLRNLGYGYDGDEYLTIAGVADLLFFFPCNDFNNGVYPIQDNRIQMLGAINGAKVIGLEHPRAFHEKLSAPENRNLAEAIIAVQASYLYEYRAEDIATADAMYLQGRIGEMMAWDTLFFSLAYNGTQGEGWLETANAYLLNERNRTFLKNALAELGQGGVFIALGAFHLPGDTGMVALLRDAGFEVTRVALLGEAAE